MKSSIRRIFSAVSLIVGAVVLACAVFGAGIAGIAAFLHVSKTVATVVAIVVAAIYFASGIVALVAPDKKPSAAATETEYRPEPAVAPGPVPQPTPERLSVQPVAAPQAVPTPIEQPVFSAAAPSPAPAPDVGRIAPYAPDAQLPEVSDEIEPELAEIEFTGEGESDALDLDGEFVTESSDEAVVPRSATQPRAAEKPSAREDDDTVARILEKIDAIISLVREGDE